MSDGQATTTANPITTYGSDATKNQIRPGGDLGTGRYYPIVNASTGKIDVYRYTDGNSTQIGSIPRGGNFTPNTQSNSAETSHFSSATGKQKFRDNAKQVVTRQWQAGGQPQPPPNTIINGENSLVDAYGTKNSKGEVVENTRVEEGGAPPSDAMESSTPLLDAAIDSATPKVKKSNTSLGAGEVVIYPQTLRSSAGSKGQDYIKMQMLQYVPKGIGDFSGGNLSGSGPRPKNRKGLGSVVLPIPGGIADNNNVSWGGDQMDPVAQAFSSVAFATVMQGVEAGGAQANKILQAAQGNSGEVKKALGTAIAGAASKTGAQVLKRTSGAIINPNMELLFNNPSLRQFNFTWKLAPRSKDESRAVVSIIRFFKQGMAAIREEPNLFLKAPNTFKLTYHHKFDDHKYLNRFKECALLNCGVQYTPDGNYATYEDGVMTAYQMTLAFQEIEPVYSDDYQNLQDDNIIGF